MQDGIRAHDRAHAQPRCTQTRAQVLCQRDDRIRARGRARLVCIFEFCGRKRLLQVRERDLIKAELPQLLAEADKICAREGVVRVDPAAGAVGVGAAGRGLLRGGGVALGHERVHARAHDRDEVDVLPLDGLDRIGELGRAVDAVGRCLRDAGLPAERAAG